MLVHIMILDHQKGRIYKNILTFLENGNFTIMRMEKIHRMKFVKLTGILMDLKMKKNGMMLKARLRCGHSLGKNTKVRQVGVRKCS